MMKHLGSILTRNFELNIDIIMNSVAAAAPSEVPASSEVPATAPPETAPEDSESAAAEPTLPADSEPAEEEEAADEPEEVAASATARKKLRLTLVKALRSITSIQAAEDDLLSLQ
jgi:hypothetical protein